MAMRAGRKRQPDLYLLYLCSVPGKSSRMGPTELRRRGVETQDLPESQPLAHRGAPFTANFEPRTWSWREDRSQARANCTKLNKQYPIFRKPALNRRNTPRGPCYTHLWGAMNRPPINLNSHLLNVRSSWRLIYTHFPTLHTAKMMKALVFRGPYDVRLEERASKTGT